MFAGPEFRSASRVNLVANDEPSEVVRWIGNPCLDVRDQSGSAPDVISAFLFDEGGRTRRREEITAWRGPKAGVEEVVKPGGIVCLGWGPMTFHAAGIGIAFAPIAQHLIDRDVTRRHRSHLDHKQAKADCCDRGIGRDRAEIESYQPTAQAVSGFISLPRENKNTLAVAERAGRALIESVVFGRLKRDLIRPNGAAHRRD